jgi:hypothetical protein
LPENTTPSKAAIAAAVQSQQKIASKKEGEVSVTYSSGASSSSMLTQTDLADLTETSFGLQLYSLLKLYSITRYVSCLIRDVDVISGGDIVDVMDRGVDPLQIFRGCAIPSGNLGEAVAALNPVYPETGLVRQPAGRTTVATVNHFHFVQI